MLLRLAPAGATAHRAHPSTARPGTHQARRRARACAAAAPDGGKAQGRRRLLVGPLRATPSPSGPELEVALASLLSSLLASSTTPPASPSAQPPARPDAGEQLASALLADWAGGREDGNSAPDRTRLPSTLLRALLGELLPPEGDGIEARAPASGAGPGLGHSLLAAAAAAAEAVKARQLDEPGGAPAPTAAALGSGTADDFDPAAWDAAAAAAAAAAADDASAEAAAASLCDPDEWEATAAAACAAAGAGSAPEPAEPRPSTHKPPGLPAPCWAVQALAGALAAAVPAASVQRLLLLPAGEAANELLQLPAAERAGVLLLLCGADTHAVLEAPVAADVAAGLGRRGTAWLLDVLSGVAGDLGLLEMGLLLAALHNTLGRAAFLDAAARLLPLEDPRDACLTLAHAAAPPPAAALQALLLHWLLAPQLATAGLPLLHESDAASLLRQVATQLSPRQLQLAGRWGSLWPLTRLQAKAAAGAPAAAAAAGGGDWQLAEASVDALVHSQAWCGLTGVPQAWLAHVADGIASALLPDAAGSAGAAGALAPVRGTLRALLLGLAPLEPAALLLLQAWLQLPAREQRVQLLLDACGGHSVADLVDRSMAAAGGAALASRHALRAAAVRVLAALPAEQLRQEWRRLQQLQLGRAGHGALPQLAVALAEAADPGQAAVLLAELAMPLWAAAWAVLASPVAGSFCWPRHELAATLAGLGSGAGGGQQLQAAWGVVAAHFALADAGAEVRARPPPPRDWRSSYEYQPGVPFIGDGWEQAPAARSGAARASCYAGGLAAFVREVLQHPLPLPAAAEHVAALAALLPADAFARLAAHLLAGLAGGGPGAADPAADGGRLATGVLQPSGLTALHRALLRLYDQLPQLPDAPLATQLLAAVAQRLPLDRVPALLVVAHSVAGALQRAPWLPGVAAAADGWEPELAAQQQLELVAAAAASGRDSAALGQLAAVVARELPPPLAALALQAWPELPAAAVAEASRLLERRSTRSSSQGTSGLAGEVVWQLGQSDAWRSDGAASRPGDSAHASSTGSASASGGFGTDRALVRQLAELIADIPAAPPAGSWPMDAMASPSYTAPLLKRCLALLITWRPSCPSAAAAAAQQLEQLAAKRAWSAAEAAALLQRLPLPTAAQLLLEAGGTGGLLQRARPKLLASLAACHGSEELVLALRGLAASYGQAGAAAFAGLLVDLRPALHGTPAGSLTDDSRDGAAAPSPYAAAVLQVLAPLDASAACHGHGASGTGAPAWASQLSTALSGLSAHAPEAVVLQLAEELGASLAPCGKPGAVATAASGQLSDWQQAAAALLAALPAAPAAARAGVTGGGTARLGLAAALAAGVAGAAGSAALLQVVPAAFSVAAAGTGAAAAAARAELAASLPELLGRLQTAGLLTCSTRVVSGSAGGSAAPAQAPGCIAEQLLALLRQLHVRDRAISLQQAVAALCLLAPSFGRALPLAVVEVLGRPGHGYGSRGSDAAEATAALEAAVAAARPTVAAVPAAHAVAARQLARVLAYLHELASDAAMHQLVTALAAVLPWDAAAAAGSAGSPGGAAAAGRCPADAALAGSGWLGVTAEHLITALLPASCAVWGVDKGTVVAASLMGQLAAAAAAASNSADAPAAVPQEAPTAGASRQLQRSSALRRGSVLPPAAEAGAQHAQRAGQALLRAAATGGASHAGRAAAALQHAAHTGGASGHAARAGAALRRAASTGSIGSGLSHAASAEAALLRAVASGAGSHAAQAEAALLAAAASSRPVVPGSHSDRAGAALQRAASSGGRAGRTDPATWATARLRAAAQELATQGCSAAAARRAVEQLVFARFHADATAVGGPALLQPAEAAAALTAALPRLAPDLPDVLAAELLACSRDLVAAPEWLAAARSACMAQQHGAAQLLQLLVHALSERLSEAATPAAYATVLSVASQVLPDAEADAAVLQLLQLVLIGEPAAATDCVVLSPHGAAQLLLELARGPSSASASASADDGDDASRQQLHLLGLAAPAVLQHFTALDSATPAAAARSDVAELVAVLAGGLQHAALLPRTYLALLLVPHLGAPQLQEAVRQTGLAACGPAAVAALDALCNRLPPGRRLPLAAFAATLAAALDCARSSAAGVSGVRYPEARLGLELDAPLRLTGLLAAVAAVLGSFRGMRQPLASPLGAQLSLPVADLAAVCVFARELLPGPAAGALAAATAAALGALPGQQLAAVLQQLPGAAAAGFGKGRELWGPLLHAMAVAGGMGDAQEGSLVQQLLQVAPSLPVEIPQRAQPDSGVRFAEPAAVTAALGPPVAVAHGVRSRAASGSVSSASSSAPPGAAGSDAEELPMSSLELIAAASLAVASSAVTGALAAGYGAAGAVVGIMWGALSLASIISTAPPSSSGSIQGSASKAQQRPVGASAIPMAAARTADDSPPPSPRTPAARDTVAGSRPEGAARDAPSLAAAAPGSQQQAVMGGRTKRAAGGAPTAPEPAAAVGYAAAAAAAAGGAPWSAGGGGLLVDPDEQLRKISSDAGRLPLDEALMQVVPLLLLPAGTAWPLLGLSAAVTATAPAISATLGPANLHLLNQVLAASLVGPLGGPLAAVMGAASLLHGDGGSSSHAEQQAQPHSEQELKAALAAAEAVHPHAVAMQLAERLLAALWRVLLGSRAAGQRGGGAASSGGPADVTTPEGAAEAWQHIATQLLTGCSPAVARRLLSGFAAQQAGDWEAELRALGVAADLQAQQPGAPAAGAEAADALLPGLLAEACARNSQPPLSFLVLLLQHGGLPLAPSDTAAVLRAVVDQLLAAHGTRLPCSSGAGGSASPSSSWQRFNPAAIFDDLAAAHALALPGVLADEAGSGGGSAPAYRPGGLVGGGSAGSAVPDSALRQVEALVAGACARGQQLQALECVLQLMLRAHAVDDAQWALAAGSDSIASASSCAVLVMDAAQLERLLALAADCCVSALQAVTAAWPAGATAASAGAVLPELLPELAAVLAAKGGLSARAETLVGAVCAGAAAAHATGSSGAPESACAAGWLNAQLAGRVLQAAAEGARAREGSVSLAKPEAAALLGGASAALFPPTLRVEDCLLLLAGVAEALPLPLALQLVAASAGRLHSVLPQAVAVVRSCCTRGA